MADKGILEKIYSLLGLWRSIKHFIKIIYELPLPIINVSNILCSIECIKNMFFSFNQYKAFKTKITTNSEK